MLIKIFIQPDAYLVFRSEDIIAIEPIPTKQADGISYLVRISEQKRCLKLTAEQADRLTTMLGCAVVRNSYSESYYQIEPVCDISVEEQN